MDIVQLLDRNGANMNIALVAAARGGHLQNVIWLVENGANMAQEYMNHWCGPALRAAAVNGHLDVVEFLIGRVTYIEPEQAHKYRQNALPVAGGMGHLQLVKRLIEMGAARPPGDCLSRALFAAVTDHHQVPHPVRRRYQCQSVRYLSHATTTKSNRSRYC